MGEIEYIQKHPQRSALAGWVADLEIPAPRICTN